MSYPMLKIFLFGVLALGISSRSSAQPASLDTEMAVLKSQMRLLERKLDRMQRQAKATAGSQGAENARPAGRPGPSAGDLKAVASSSEATVSMTDNRPTICTADQRNCVSITGRINFDAGGYDYRPAGPATVPQKLDDGVNVRRARIGLAGRFFDDWSYALIYDFGGSSDGFGGTAAAGGTPVGFLPGGALSGIENAYLSFTGFRPFGGKMAIEGGIMDIPYTIEEATSSNDTPFMERASSQVIAQSIAAGDFRSTFGARWYTDRFWAGAYVTGPALGAVHSASSINPAGTSEQVGSIARAAGQIASGSDYSLHIGANAEWLIRPPRNQITGAQTLTLSDRPELRIDPTSIVSTGAIAGVSGAQVYSLEAAGTYGPLFLQGEYYWYNVDRGNLPLPSSSVRFDGGYLQASYVFTGEFRKYNPAFASYGPIRPLSPFSPDGGGWGAWEIAGRVSTIDLNDQLMRASGIAGGRQTVYAAALNWYVNSNVRFMFDYLHGEISKQASSTNPTNAGASFDAFAMRTQVAF